MTLVTGAAAAQAITLCAAPVLTRLFRPDEFGAFALFAGVVALVGAVSAGRYEYAIILPKHDEEASNVLALSIFLVACITLVSIFVTAVAWRSLHSMSWGTDFEGWLPFVPVAVLFTGIYQCLVLWNNRQKQFTATAISRVVLSSGTALFSIVFGYFQGGALSLIYGAVLGQISAAVVLYWFTYRRQDVLFHAISISKMTALARRYSDFPRINVFQVLLDNLNVLITLFVIAHFFGLAVVGLYSFVMRVLQAPIGVVSSALNQVLYQRMAEMHANNHDMSSLVMRTIKRLAVGAVVPVMLLVIVGPTIFRFVFGEKWEEAGVYAQILAPYMGMYLLASSLSFVPFVVMKQRESFWIGACGNGIFVLAICVGALLDFGILLTLALFSVTATVFFVLYIFWISKIARVHVQDPT